MSGPIQEGVEGAEGKKDEAGSVWPSDNHSGSAGEGIEGDERGKEEF